MNQFGRDINFIHSTLSLVEAETDFTYLTFVLGGEDQARIFRVHQEELSPERVSVPPTQGRFVAAALMDDDTQRLLLAFCEYPPGSEESRRLHALAYDAREIEKAPKHVAGYLIHGVVPIADGEYDPARITT